MSISVSETATEAHPRESQHAFWLEVLVVVVIIATGVFLRYYKIGEVPPGLNSDEAVGAVGALETLHHGPQLYYAGQGGGGSLGFYIAAIGFAIFGPSVATIRGTAAFVGVIGVVASYFATREMFRTVIGLNRARLLAALTALALAASLWHTETSRVAFAAVGVPLLQVPGNYFLWRGLNTDRRVYFVISGVFLASLMYIYLSGSFAPFVYLVFFLLQWLVTIVQFKLPHHDPRSVSLPLIKQHFWNLVICAGVAFAIFLPMLYFYLTAPDLATERAQQALFTNPLINQGDPWGTLRRSIWGNLAAFGLSTSWLHGQPPTNLIMPIPMTLLFLVGIVVSLWRVRQPPYLFTLVYWGIMLLPSILSPDSIPHRLRAVGAAPATYTLVAIGAMAIVDFGLRAANWGLRVTRSSSNATTISRQPPVISIFLSAAILLALGLLAFRPLYREFQYYFVEWPKTNDAQAGYHVYAVKLAEEMSKESNPQATFLLPRDTAAGDVNPNYTVMFLYNGEAGYAWVVDDENTIEATLNDAVQGRDVVHLIHWKTSKHTGADPKEVIRYYLEKHGTLVDVRSYEDYDIETYQLNKMGPDMADGPLMPASVDFAEQITLAGYAYGDASGSDKPDTPSVPAGDLLWVRLRLRATAPIREELKASVIVADGAGHVVGQIDKLLLSNFLHQDSEDWAPGTEVEAHFLIPVAPATAPGDYRLGLAIYDTDSLARLPSPFGDAAQVVTLGSVTVRPDLSQPSAEVLGLDLALDRPLTKELTLLGLTTAASETLRPGERASVALTWQANAAPTNDYQASLWVSRDDDAWPLTAWLPLAGIDYPSSQWAAGQIVRGWFDGRVPPDLASGDYSLDLRVTDPDEVLVAEVPLGKLDIQGWARQFTVPDMQVIVDADFGDQMELIGYDVRLPSDTSDAPKLNIIIYWRALSEMDTSYIGFVHLLDEAGQVISQVDHVPGDGAFPTSGWLPGEVIADEYQIPYPSNAALEDEAIWAVPRIEIGVYDPATGHRLPVLNNHGEIVADHIVLSLSE
jgi:hypothetical protein